MVEGAIDMWHNKLGDPSKESGHCVQFKTDNSPGSPHYCFVPDGSPEGSWNDNRYPKDSLVILRNDDLDAPGYSTLGYKPHGPKPNNIMVLNPSKLNVLGRVTIAHEFGTFHTKL
jgi:hypothetical protein